ncbi:glycosyltransferase family 9 protein [soil metagenome]|nr:glycosyltransferase family 9 protein [Gemmatimonadota bacterium]
MQPTDLAGRRIALVMMSAIGDVVHALPLVNSIRAAAPDAHLTWVIQPVPRQLLDGHPAVDEFLPFHRGRGWRAYPEVHRLVRARAFDLVLDPHVFFKAGVVTAMLRAPRKVGYDRARAPDLNWLFSTERLAPRPRAHAQDEMLEFVDHLGIPRVLDWGLGPTDEERARYAELLPRDDRPTVALVLGSSKAEKDWPAERYLPLVDRLTADPGARTILIGGRSERENRVAGMLGAHAASPPLDLREWDLRRLVYLLERTDVLVSPDTGPMHIGVALDTPTVSLMGHTNPKRVGPYRYRDLLIDAFGEPGELYTADAGYRMGRMQRISVDDVLARVRLALQRYGRAQRGSGRGSGPGLPRPGVD